MLLAGVAFIDSVDRGILPGVLDDMQIDLGFSDFKAGLLGSVFVLMSFLTVLPAGYLADRRRRTRLIAVVLASWGVLSALTAGVQSFWQLATVRAALGVGETVDNPASQSLIADFYEPSRRGRAFAFQRAAPTLGSAIGLALGGGIGAAFGWRWAFLIAGVPGSLLALAMWRLPEPARGASDVAPGAELDPVDVTEPVGAAAEATAGLGTADAVPGDRATGGTGPTLGPDGRPRRPRPLTAPGRERKASPAAAANRPPGVAAPVAASGSDEASQTAAAARFAGDPGDPDTPSGPGVSAPRGAAGFTAGAKALLADARVVLRIRTLRALMIGTAVSSGALAGFGFWAAAFYKRHTSLTGGSAAAVVGVLILIGALAGTLLGGFLADRLRVKGPGAPMTVAGVGGIFAALTLGSTFLGVPLWYLIPAQFVGVACAVAGLPALAAMVTEITPATIRGTAFSVTAFLSSIASAVSPLLLGFLADLDKITVDGLQRGNLERAFLLVTPLVAVGGWIVLRGRRFVEADQAAAREQSFSST